MRRLRIFHQGRVILFPLREPVLTLGSDGGNDIVLAGGDLPPLAARIRLAEDGYRLESVSAKVKTLRNGKREDAFALAPGDLAELGSARLLVEDDGPGPAEAERARGDSALSAGLSALCAMVAEEHDLKTLLGKAMRLLLDQLGGDEALLFTVDASGRPEVSVSTRKGGAEPLFSDTIVERVLRAGKSMVLGNALADPAYARSQSVVELQLRSVLCSPILVAGRVSGLIYLGSSRPNVSYGESALRDLEAYALVVGCLANHIGYIGMQGRILADLGPEGGGPGFIASCPAMQAVVREARAVAGSDIAVLLQGETGTGKDVLAQFIHRQSRRAGKPFLALNCSTLRGELLASELFGHKKGAFTGALQDQRGIFQAADGGTLFLDEIGEMDLPLQAMLLRTLETGMVRPVGQASEVKVEVRILCATNRNLEERMASGAFRQDLFYRINQHCITLPALRERGDDVLLLAHWFLEKAKPAYPDKALSGFLPESLLAISRYRWPGNVRELANAVAKAALFADSPAVRVSLPQDGERWMDMDEATRRFQVDYLQRALQACGGDKDKAAALLGMGRSTFFRYLAGAKGDKPDV